MALLQKGKRRQRHRCAKREQHVKVNAQMSDASSHPGMPVKPQGGGERHGTDFLSQPLEETGPTNTSISDVQPLEL